MSFIVRVTLAIQKKNVRGTLDKFKRKIKVELFGKTRTPFWSTVFVPLLPFVLNLVLAFFGTYV